MLLSMLILGGILLGASTIAGLLMLYQLRQSSNVSQSARAIFAADTGIEWGLYCDVKIKPPVDCSSVPKPVMANGTSFDVTFYPATSTPGNYDLMKSIGRSGKTSRAFQLFFAGATSTLP